MTKRIQPCQLVISVLAVLLLLSSALVLNAAIGTSLQMQLGNPSGATSK
jgi:hypothetical protein